MPYLRLAYAQDVKRTPYTDENGALWLTRAQAAWCARIDSETVRRWMTDGQLETREFPGRREALIAWTSFEEKAADRHGPPLHPRWMAIAGEQAVASLVCGTPAAEAPGVGAPPDAAALQAALDEALAARDEARADADKAAIERDKARADAESADQAAMAFRDNWRRHTQPHDTSDVV